MRELIASLLVSFLYAQAPIPGQAPADSPITWRTTAATPVVKPASALELSRRYLGRGGFEDGAPQLVEITDRDELGLPVRARTAYLTFFRSIQLLRPTRSDTAWVDLCIAVDATTGELLLAFTPAKETWTARQTPRRSADYEASVLGWTPRATSVAMSSSVVDVLNAVFATYGSQEFDVGQIVARPRWVEQKFPARPEDHVPINPPGNAWFVHAMGGFMGYKYPPPAIDGSPGHPYYWTEELILVADSTLVVCGRGGMP